ncbi:hypothetical protein BCAR13_1140053 [Paraburkholderia caribensis]|nr:hypothetical protein BCAR13_1140053 [Paraburkholderia caribensis]
MRFSESTSMRSALSTTVKPSLEEGAPRFVKFASAGVETVDLTPDGVAPSTAFSATSMRFLPIRFAR